MKIRQIDIFKVPPRWVFLKITTESGITGWGEPVVEGRSDTVIAAIREMIPLLIGWDARKIEDIFQVLSKGGFYRDGVILMSAISGIDQALWDIKGKALGVPVYQLLGGSVRDKMRIYSWVGGDTPEDTAALAKKKIDEGFTAIKMNLSGKLEFHVPLNKVKEIKNNIRKVRDAIGDENDLAIDFHGRVSKNMVKRFILELQEFAPMFYEEVVLPEFSYYFKQIAPMTNIPLAAGERLVGRKEFKDIIYHGALDIIQPDLSHVGGIWEAKKIAAWAETSGILVALHCPLGPIAFAASLQFDFCTHNAMIQETSMGIHYNNDIDLLSYIANKDDFKIQKGFIYRNDKPGLGVEIDEERVISMSKQQHDWKNPIWRNEDGAFTEW
ncbi:MAG TPA: galactonate dehydratase [Puia sp.]|jgi:galactonate dehydratase